MTLFGSPVPAIVRGLPKPGTAGAPTEWQPNFSTWKVQEITRRSFARGTQRTLSGKCGLSRPICVSLNQNILWEMATSLEEGCSGSRTD